MTRHWLILLTFCAALASCGGKQRKAPPVVPDGLTIAVEHFGKASGPIDSKRLIAAKPDFSDGERLAWRIDALEASVAATPGTLVEVFGAAGAHAVVPAAGDDKGRVPTLYLNLHGEILFTMVDPKDPYPAFHGRGGNRGRKPVTGPVQIRNVEKLRFFAANTGGAGSDSQGGSGAGDGSGDGTGVSQEDISLEIVVNGAAPLSWNRAALNKLPPIKIAGDAGGERDAYGLRDLANALGPNLAAIELVSASGEKLAIAAADWSDASQVPVLRINRRAQVKFTWTRNGEPQEAGELREVKTVRVATVKK